MSLDVTLIGQQRIKAVGTGIFVREEGAQRELTLDEVKEKWPDYDATEVETDTNEVYTANITHNLNKMAMAAGLYDALWHPEELKAVYAKDLIDPLTAGLEKLKAEPEEFKKHNPENGWGSYEQFVEFTEKYLTACKANPEARIDVSR